MSEPFLAEIRMFAGQFAPRGWASCDGQLLPISQNTALFSLLGTYYGGDGKSNFALPDFAGRTPMSTGFNGQSDYVLGQSAGTPTVSLTGSELPLHNHSFSISSQPALARQPSGQLFATGIGVGFYGSNSGQTTNLNQNALQLMGGSLPHNNMMPFLTLFFIIAMQGVYPARG